MRSSEEVLVSREFLEDLRSRVFLVSVARRTRRSKLFMAVIVLPIPKLFCTLRISFLLQDSLLVRVFLKSWIVFRALQSGLRWNDFDFYGLKGSIYACCLGFGMHCSRVCGNSHGMIRKYGLNTCRQCFRIYSKDIGFVKVSPLTFLCFLACPCTCIGCSRKSMLFSEMFWHRGRSDGRNRCVLSTGGAILLVIMCSLNCF